MREQGGENRKRRMRIGIFQDAFFPMIDGVVEVVDHYAREMQRYADVTVVVPEVPGEPFDDSIFPYRVVRCRAVRVPVLDYCLPVPLLDPAFLRKVRRMRFDVVHIHSPFTLGALGVRYAKTRHIPVIGTMHTQFQRDFQ
ncbi:MAG: glycosyltransferase, partial [Lachnospiraceae bacterium]|nr:glycosyltransferase [Lachnospiraceae bacterium]